nr:retrovirus-related Pol polyprotein from transposon TNT 1-94 [Tanacetum cinerariifolium]
MLINLKWIFKVKLDEYGGVQKNKAQLVAKGYHEEERIDFEESFEPVVLIESIHLHRKYGLDQCDAVDIPIVERSKLDEDPNRTPVDPTRYQSMVGSLLYLTASHPDLVFANLFEISQQPMRSKEELCAINMRFPPNKSNVRIDPKEILDKPLHDISLEILKNNTIYNALTLTTEVRLDSLLHLIADEARLEKLKYVAKGECTPTFGMPIPEAIMSSEMNESQVYADYVKKYPQVQSVPKHGIFKGLMRKGDVLKPKKKNDVVPRRKRSITVDDNVLSDPDEALEYATQSASDEERTKSDESDNNSKNANDQTKDFMIKLHEKDQEQPPKTFPTPSPSVTATLAEDYTRFLTDSKDVQMSKMLNEPLLTEATTMMVSPILETCHKTHFSILKIISERKRRREFEKMLVSLRPRKAKLKRNLHTMKEMMILMNQRHDDDPVHEGHKVQTEEIPDKITKEDVEGPTFKLLRGTYKNSLEHEYNMDQCHLALTDKIDWINPKGDRFHRDLSKSLPLIGPLGRKRILVSYFFNHDLEYLKYGIKENTYALSVTKFKAARYEDEGIEEMILTL